LEKKGSKLGKAEKADLFLTLKLIGYTKISDPGKYLHTPPFFLFLSVLKGIH
tara:strand:+ start:746 stop:901 length:156 start_codon:yes stop_codon:yes gene_type:complete